MAKKKISFIAWTRYHRRSELLARHFEATLHYVYFGQMGKISQAPLRYIVQGLRTWRILRSERPDVIFVQNPPIFSVAVVALYARRYGAHYVIDSHTAAFLSPKWRWSLGLHRVLSRRALTTVVHNQAQAGLLARWGCPYCVLAFTPGDYPRGEPYPLSNKFNVAVICSYQEDEPLDLVFESARCVSDVFFYMTGESQRLARPLLVSKPENVFLTGYLPYNRYVGLLRGVDAIIDLVNTDSTMLMGGFEGVSLGTPLILSDWPTLRNYFSTGTIHVPNTVAGLCEGIRRAEREQVLLRQGISTLREQLEAEANQKLKQLEHILQKD